MVPLIWKKYLELLGNKMQLKISEVEILMFTKHLSVMVKAGVPITESLSNLEKAAQGNSKKVILAILKKVDQGETLAESIHKSSPSFDAIYISLIRIGEESGKLDVTLAFLSQQLAKVYSLKRKIKGATLYPTIVIGLMFTIGMALSLFVLPKLTDFFVAFDTNLPLSTKILLWLANLMKNYGFLIVGGFIGAVFLLGLLLNTKKIKPWWHKVLFKMPYVGRLIQDSKITESLRNLSILLSSGVPITESWKIVSQATDNEYLRQDLEKVGEEIQKGSMISEGMQKIKITSVPYLAQKMISIGERTGKVDEMAMYVADYYEEELDAASKNLTTVLEPILLIVVGLMVAFLALAVISPIYQITGSIGG